MPDHRDRCTSYEGTNTVSAFRYAVIGAGNGGLALGGELALRDKDVALLEIPSFEYRLAPLRAQGGIRVEARTASFAGGTGDHFAPLKTISTDLSVLRDVDIVVPVVPGQHHGVIIDAVLPHLRPGQVVLVNPGGVGGALVWAKAIRAAGLTKIRVAQTADLTYAGSRNESGAVLVKGKKARVLTGVFPAAQTEELIDSLAEDFPEFVAATNVIEAGLSGPGMMVHPLPMIMNAVKIDRDQPLKYDAYDISPSVAKVIDCLDAERMRIVEGVGAVPQSISAILGDFYGAKGSTFYEVVHNVASYKGSTAPKDFSARYITEEVPTHAVPAAVLARALGIENSDHGCDDRSRRRHRRPGLPDDGLDARSVGTRRQKPRRDKVLSARRIISHVRDRAPALTAALCLTARAGALRR